MMCTFKELEVGSFFEKDGSLYRKVLHAKSWDPTLKNIRYYNAVCCDGDSDPMHLFSHDEEVVSI